MASNGFKKLMLGMEELGHELDQGDDYFNLLYSYVDEEELHSDNNLTESSEDVQYGVHQFSTDAVIFRGTEEECAKYIDDRKELWDDAEVYRMTPDDPHYQKTDALEEAYRDETIELEYKNLDFTQYGNQRDVDDWDEFDGVADWKYDVDKNDLYTFIFEDCIDTEDFPDAFESEFNPNDEADWKSFTTWLDNNYDEIFGKYEDKILSHYEDEAREDAEKNYDPEDYIDWDSMPSGHDDYRFDEDVEEKICCICKQPYEGYGNNAEPVCSGRCCDKCNMEKVMPMRFKMMKNDNLKESKKLNEADDDFDVMKENINESTPVTNKIPAPYDKYFEIIEVEYEEDDASYRPGDRVDDATILADVAPKKEYEEIFDSIYSLIDDPKFPVVEIIHDRIYPVELPQEEATESIDTILDSFGGADELKDRIADIKDNYLGIEDDEIAEMLCDEDHDYEDCLSAVEYLDSSLDESLEDMDKRCETCNTLLNDQGTCPKCDDGEEDYDDDFAYEDDMKESKKYHMMESFFRGTCTTNNSMDDEF